MILKGRFILILVVMIFMIFACNNEDQTKVKDDQTQVDYSYYQKLVEESKPLDPPNLPTSISDRNLLKSDVLWDSLEKTKSTASFSLKVNKKLPEYNFKIVGSFKGDDFLPQYLEITDKSGKKRVIQKIKIHTDDDDGWMPWTDIVQVVDLNGDGYLDLRLLYAQGATGNDWYSTYFYDPSAGKFKYHKELSKLCNLDIDKKSKIITNHSEYGWCCESWGYYLMNSDKLTLRKIEWTEMDRTRDKEVGGPACFKYSGIPRSKDAKIDIEDFTIYEKLKYLKKKLKNIKEEGPY